MAYAVKRVEDESRSAQSALHHKIRAVNLAINVASTLQQFGYFPVVQVQTQPAIDALTAQHSRNAQSHTGHSILAIQHAGDREDPLLISDDGFRHLHQGGRDGPTG